MNPGLPDPLTAIRASPLNTTRQQASAACSSLQGLFSLAPVISVSKSPLFLTGEVVFLASDVEMPTLADRPAPGARAF